MLKCPKCNEKLIQINRSYQCIHHHTFDIARSGYVNLSLKNKKNSGDNEKMVKARSLFLEEGYYDFMRQYVKNVLKKEDILVDAGCGQGYYTKEFSDKVKQCYGLDLSKEAILYASKKDKKTDYFVASLFNMPFFSETIDCVTSIFVPLGKEEIVRILKPGGKWIVVGPGPKHCWELKEFLYETPYENEKPAMVQEGFELIEQNTIKQSYFVKDLWSLLEMTPYRYKTSLEALDRLKSSEGFEVTFEFIISVWRKL